jgi:hypothetical protein
MTPAWLLLARLDGMIARLDQAKKALATEGLNTRLQERIGKDLERRLSEYMQTLKVRRKKVVADDRVPDNAWSEVKSSASSALLDECLLYLQAARSRGADVAPDLCEITDALFEELALKASSVVWKRFSVFAAEDSFDVMTDVIRVRYPVSGVWDIAVAVHEFGHFLSGRLRHLRDDGSSSLAFQEHRNSVVPPQQTAALGIDWRVWVDEIFADVFATFAVGPSFGCSCLLFRFDPSSAEDEADGKHPSYAKRAYVILRALRHLNNEQPMGKLMRVIELLDSSWRGACQSAGTSPELSENYQTWLDGQVSTLYFMLRTDVGGLKFQGWESAQNKAGWLEKLPDPPEEFTLVELLNAAWICRLKENSYPERLSENFVNLARQKTERYDR